MTAGDRRLKRIERVPAPSGSAAQASGNCIVLANKLDLGFFLAKCAIHTALGPRKEI